MPKNLWCYKMEKKTMSLMELHEKRTARIVELEGGAGFQRKLRVMGIREGQIIHVVTKQPFKGPLTIRVCGGHLTLGRGMARRIIVEEI